MDWQAIFFDFDGVVLDTTRIKTAAFGAMYRGYGAAVEAAVVAHHRAHGGISRLLKLRHFEERILGRVLTDDALAALCDDFSSRVLTTVLAAPFIPGARETLEHLERLGTPAFVVSGTPQAELEHVIDHRDLRRFFAEIHGSPPLKPAILADVLQRHALQATDCLFLGDALTDQRAARALGLPFLGIEPPGDPHPFGAGTAVARRAFVPGRAELAALLAPGAPPEV